MHLLRRMGKCNGGANEENERVRFRAFVRHETEVAVARRCARTFMTISFPFSPYRNVFLPLVSFFLLFCHFFNFIVQCLYSEHGESRCRNASPSIAAN